MLTRLQFISNVIVSSMKHETDYINYRYNLPLPCKAYKRMYRFNGLTYCTSYRVRVYYTVDPFVRFNF